MNQDTLLLRQIHPAFVQQGRITSQAFRPTPKDGNLLSVYDGDRIGAATAWKHYTGTLKHASSGVLAVTSGECAALDLPTRNDPAPFPEHAVIDFSDLSKNLTEKKAKQLKFRAETRDWLYRAET